MNRIGTEKVKMVKSLSLLTLVMGSVLSGCGSESTPAANGASDKAILNSSSAPSGSSSTAAIPVVTTPSSNTNPSNTGSTTTSGTSAPIDVSMTAYGPLDSQTAAQAPKYINLGYHTNLGIDRRLRLALVHRPTPGRFDSVTGTYIGGQSNYTRIDVTVTLKVNGVAASSQVLSASEGQAFGTPVDFSSAVYNYTNGSSSAYIQLEISHVKTNNKLLTNFCMSDYNSCYLGMVNIYGSAYARSTCSTSYYRCLPNISPVAKVTEFQGWSIGIKVETDTTPRLN